MAFDWTKFLALAEILSQRPDDEAAARSAVSRAYYAAFHVARDEIDPNRDRAARRGSDHGRVAELVGRMDLEAALQLRRLRNQRNAADYDAEWVEDSVEEVQFALDRARRVIDRIRELG